MRKLLISLAALAGAVAAAGARAHEESQWRLAGIEVHAKQE